MVLDHFGDRDYTRGLSHTGPTRRRRPKYLRSGLETIWTLEVGSVAEVNGDHEAK